jgi:PIN domain nuclease of toxin-antitoxin system
VTGVLLDSHVALWLLQDEPLAPEAITVVTDPSIPLFLSIATPWELAIKQGLSQLRLGEDYLDLLASQGIELLGITPAHTRALRDLPLHHRDPFDRIFVAQAQLEGLTLVIRDGRLRQYDVALLEA